MPCVETAGSREGTVKVEDQGLGGVLFELMTGKADRRYYPGLNVLIRDETKPGGLLYSQLMAERAALKHFLDKYPKDEAALMLMLVTDRREGAWRDFSIKLARYVLRFAPLLQPHGLEENTRWNRFWSGRDEMPSPALQAAMARELARDMEDLAAEAEQLAREEEAPGGDSPQ